MLTELDQIVAANGGFFRRADALAVGYTDRDLQQARRTQQIVRLRHGSYAPADAYARASPGERHLVLAGAVISAQRQPVALTGPSAAVLHGHAVWGHDLEQVHLVRLDGASGRREAGVVHHRMTKDIVDALCSVGGFVAVNPARALWEVAVMSDLESAVITADSALHGDPAMLPDLRGFADSFAHRPGSRTARLALRLADPATESPGESIVRVKCYRFGIPRPVAQYVVRASDGREVGRCDYCWPQYRHLGEFDGKVKYAALLRPGEDPSDVVFREKQREDALRAAGYGMSRWTWADLDRVRVATTMARLKEALARSRRLYVRGRSAA